ncbi:MAG: hypothetical protein EA381_02375 [Planctomycetaceae bacterium]|nr:MAG: hypothetical protein EA381_02375 [Planctomycetaceae bacterium]
MTGRPPRIELPPEIEAEMTPDAKAFVVSLIESIRLLTHEAETLTKQPQTLVEQEQTLTKQSQKLADQVDKLSGNWLFEHWRKYKAGKLKWPEFQESVGS